MAKKDIRKIVKEGYEKGGYAGHFRTSSKPNKMEKKFLDRLAGFVPEGAKILDLGCGIGIPFDKYLVDKGLKVTGIDVVHKHIEQAKKNIPNATFIEGDFSKMDFGGEHFYAIIAFYSIFHIPREEQQDLFKKMYDLLKDEGVVLMTLATGESDSVEKDWCGAPMAWSSYGPPRYKAMIAQANFKIVESEYEGQPGDKEHHWWVIIKKK